MKYATVRDLRGYLQFLPIKITDESLGIGDGVKKVFFTTYKPIVDFDYDNQIVDDVEVKVNGTPVVVQAVDELTGRIELQTAPPLNAGVTATYYWHPFSDSELKQAIETAEAEIDNECGRSFEKKEYVEKITMTRGNKFMVANTPLHSITYIKILGVMGDIIETLSVNDYTYSETGIVELKKYYAGIPIKPWYLPLQFTVEIKYLGGYDTIPGIVSHATLLIASYQLLLKISHLMTIEPEYQGKVALAFKKPEEIVDRLEYLRSEIENIKRRLPHRVSLA